MRYLLMDTTSQPSSTIACGILCLMMGVCYNNASSQRTTDIPATNRITPRRDAPELRRIWLYQDHVDRDNEIGAGVGGLGDIYGSRSSAWAVRRKASNEWLIFNNRVPGDTTPVQRFTGSGITHARIDPETSMGTYPIVGDFWGSGHPAVCFAWQEADSRYWLGFRYRLDIHRTEADTIDRKPSAVLSMVQVTPTRGTQASSVMAADLNGDGADELIVVLRSGLQPNYPELWIYRGGSAFQVDTPTVVVTHPMPRMLPGYEWIRGHLEAAVGDFDGDDHPDILIGRGDGADSLDHLTFYWGNGTLEGYADTNNRRIVQTFPGSHPAVIYGLTALDCDGDGMTDLAFNGYPRTPERTTLYLYRSNSGHSARTRTYRYDNADWSFPESTTAFNAGFLNDGARRYEMLSIMYATGVYEGLTRLFAGSRTGPDYPRYASIDDGYPYMMPLADVDGDGWDDLIAGKPHQDGTHEGMAVIYAGGPYIPDDAATVNVTGEDYNAITIWPYPAREELNITWRGDLHRMPSRFGVHDALGREVARGEVEPWRGAAVWQCAGAPAGVYLVAIYDGDGAVIATTPIIKQ